MALSPVMLFLLWNTPPLGDARAITGHSVTLLAHWADCLTKPSK